MQTTAQLQYARLPSARRFIFYGFMAVKIKKQNPKSNPFRAFVYDVFAGGWLVWRVEVTVE